MKLSWRHITYFVGVPLIVGVYAGLNNWEMQHIAGPVASILFYMGHSLLPWWTTCSLTWLTKLALERWKPPWIMILLIGHTLGCLVVVPYSNWFTALFETRWPSLEITGHVTALLSLEFWIYWVRAGVIWIGINFIFDRFIGLPLYRYDIPKGYENVGPPEATGSTFGDDWAGRSPGFVAKLPAKLAPSEVFAIKAEQHYIKVYSPEKEYMVLYRFSDAVRALDESLGFQVHRSYWVNKSAIESIRAKAKDFSIRLKSGQEIPVSSPYQGLIREFARTERIQLKG